MMQPRGISLLLASLATLVVAGPALGGAVAVGDDQAAATDDAHALAAHAIANQHRNDAAIMEYERIERHYEREGSAIVDDKTYRIVPTGTGTLKLLVKDNGHPVSPASYRKQLRDWERILAVAINPNDSREKESEQKAAKRARDRAELVDDVRDAFRFAWLSRETRDGRTLVKLGIEPNPAFHPRSRNAELLTHVRAIIWIDENAVQVARIEAETIRDISFGGGFLGKIYRGGRFEMEQEEVTPGVWLPTQYQYDFEGRKLFFGFSLHETTEISRYRHDGPPKESLAIVRSELATGRGFSGDP